MLQTFGNFDKIFQYAKNKGIDALNALKQYKLDLEQASQIDAETRRVLSETSQRVQNVHDNLSDKIAESTNQYNAALANSKQILKRARSTAMTNADIK
jgi:gas vesicle protein